VYVGAKFEQKELVRDAIAQLTAANHVVTHDWTFEDATEFEGIEQEMYLARCAAEDIQGVVEADAVILFPHEKGKGLYVEMGVGVALNKQIIVIGDKPSLPNCIFFHLEDVIVVPDLALAIETLENLTLMADA
jgi:hypothetical protein